MTPIITTMSAPAGRGRRVKAPSASTVTPFFEDSFAGGQRNNANGFTWDTSDLDVTVATFDGGNCLRFRFGPDAPGDDSNAEQRFNTGRNSRELWMEYELYVPTNFVVRNEAPANNKFLAVWALNYSTTGDTQIVVEYDRTSSTEYGVRVLSINGGADSGGTKFAPLLTTAMNGTWRRIRFHIKNSTTQTSADGQVELWRDSTKIYEFLTHNLHFDSGNSFFRNGFLLGYANSGFLEETDFYVRNFKLYDTDPNWSF